MPLLGSTVRLQWFARLRIWLYIHAYACLVCVSVCVFVCLRLSICIYLCLFAPRPAYVCLYVCACLLVCLRLSICIYLCLRLNYYVRLPTSTSWGQHPVPSNWSLMWSKQQHSDGKSAQGTLNPIFSRAGGTLINQGTQWDKWYLLQPCSYSSEKSPLIWMVRGSETLRWTNSG